MTNKKHTAQDSANAGLLASGMLTSVVSSMGERIPERVQDTRQLFAGAPGLYHIKQFHSLLIAGLVFFGGGMWLIHTFRDTALVKGGMIAFVIVGCFTALGYSFSVIINSYTYTAMRLKCRLYPVGKPSPTYGLSETGHPLGDILLILPFRLALVGLMLPFLFLGMVYEVLRVVLGNLIGKKNISYRGDAGKYYDKVRKHYARVYHDSGVAEANEYLRLAFSGMITPLGKEIPSSEWSSAQKRNALLATFIRRHGPIEKYCTGQPGQENGHSGQQFYDLSKDARTHNKVPDKYSAI